MTKLIFHSNFTGFQKVMLSIVFIISFLITVSRVFYILTNDFGQNDNIILKIISLIFIPIVISLSALIALLLKKGILIENQNLYAAQFLFGSVFYRKKADLLHITDISILKFTGKVKYNNFSKSNPDLDYEIFLNEIYLLNQKHTDKRFLIATQNKELAEKAVDLIKDSFHLDFNLYNPRFYE